jgi:hypothetical protein
LCCFKIIGTCKYNIKILKEQYVQKLIIIVRIGARGQCAVILTDGVSTGQRQRADNHTNVVGLDLSVFVDVEKVKGSQIVESMD